MTLRLSIRLTMREVLALRSDSRREELNIMGRLALARAQRKLKQAILNAPLNGK
jgi:hypothetical protein